MREKKRCTKLCIVLEPATKQMTYDCLTNCELADTSEPFQISKPEEYIQVRLPSSSPM